MFMINKLPYKDTLEKSQSQAFKGISIDYLH